MLQQANRRPPTKQNRATITQQDFVVTVTHTGGITEEFEIINKEQKVDSDQSTQGSEQILSYR